ncbi:MAG TPA: hypothetical protein VF668_06275 [Pyrinomonadaceae bacterium]|jgi:hypothetical protein
MRAGGASILFALLAGLAPWPGGPSAARAQSKFAAFVVTGSNGETQVEPVALVDGGGAFEEPVSAGAEEGAASAFFERYYRPGTRYRLIYGGAEAGSVTIREATRAECAPMAARAQLSTTVRLGRSFMALATDAPRALRAGSSRRAPTAREQAAALRLAKSVLLGKRAPAAAVNRSTATLSLVATDLDGDGRDELVGSFLVRSGPRVRDGLFLVAAPRGDGYAALIQNHARVNAREMMDASLIGEVGKGAFLSETFVEQFDADGDGVGELFTAAGSFEGTTYKVYRRVRGAWRAVYEHYGYRCAF